MTNTNGELRVAIADMWQSKRWRGALDSPVFKLLSQRLSLVESDDPDLLVYSVFGESFRSHRCRRIFYTGENRTPDPRDCDASLSFRPTSDDNYYLPLYKWRIREHNIRPPDDIDEVIEEKTRFCNFIYGNPKPQDRLAFLAELTSRRHVDCGGSLLNNIEGSVGVTDKLAFVRECRFTIAFENESIPGYTTEKLFDAYEGNTVPIYWGDPTAVEIFNPRAFINCYDFPSWSAVADYVNEVDSTPELYRSYLEQPLFPGGGVPTFLQDDAILDWLVPRVTATARPVARTFGGFSRDTWRRSWLGSQRTSKSVAQRLSRSSTPD
jgi:hypothetical protein